MVSGEKHGLGGPHGMQKMWEFFVTPTWNWNHSITKTVENETNHTRAKLYHLLNMKLVTNQCAFNFPKWFSYLIKAG